MTDRPRSRRTQVAAVLAAATLITAGIAVPAHAAAAKAPPAAPKVDNPYADGKGYVNPEWKANAATVPGGSLVADTSTAVWLDEIAAIKGQTGTGAKAKMGLRDHLDAALAEGAAHVQFVLYNLPGRRCGEIPRNELDETEIRRYKRKFIDPIAAIQANPKYRSLRIINIVEPDSLSDQVVKQTGQHGTDLCRTIATNGTYQAGIAYALGKLAAIPNVYNYLDGSNYQQVGWEEHRGDYVALLAQVARSARGGMGTVHGFAVNTANYSATVEPYLDMTTPMIRSSKFIDWNTFADQQSYATALRTELIAAGFAPSIGMVIDTSRNGWGGPSRPTEAAKGTWLVDEYVNKSRIDRRFSAQNWCNQKNAGLGERPTANPAPGIDAYVWAKPPGESDGSYQNPDWQLNAQLCDPHYSGSRSSNYYTEAMADAPARGEWFAAHFNTLLRNAYPPLPKVDNPYVGGKGYVNSEWKAKAEAIPGGARISNTSTAIWLDSIAAIEGSGTGATKKMGLRAHLDAAVAQGAKHVQVVLYNLPGRHCAGLSSSSELRETEIERYKREFIDPIAEIESYQKYRDLRIINVIEPDSLSEQIVYHDGPRGTNNCRVIAANGTYQAGIAYALDKLAPISSVYNYLDGSNYQQVGWTEYRQSYVSLLAQVARSASGGMGTVHGFVVNTAGYSATVEPYIDMTIPMIRSAKFIDWNNFVDQQSYATALRTELIAAGFASSIGMVIDTSRNGWGGAKRPTEAASTTLPVDEYVNKSRIDRRPSAEHWCNQKDAGLGERPTANPAPGIDAYVWAKPPGESDGWFVGQYPSDGDPMCDPKYMHGTSVRSSSGAMENPPDRGEWFPEHFAQLMRNAYPPLPKADNPYVGDKGYVNSEWKAKAEAHPGGARISNTSTAIWLDSIAAIDGSGTGAEKKMGLRAHLDAAVEQRATHVQVVLYNLPGRRCGQPVRGELGPTEIERYKREFIDKIAEIESYQNYRDLRIVNIIEPDSLSDQHLRQTGSRGVEDCRTMAANGNYQAGIAYALGKLALAANVYNYLDGSNYHQVGWETDRGGYVSLLAQVARSAHGGMRTVHGFAINTAGYSATVEPYLDMTTPMIRSAKFIDWNTFVDQQSYATALRTELIAAGFASSIGMVIDTSRNGWGGAKRPTEAASTTLPVDEYVNKSRIDRRSSAQNWCNQSGAGIGERPAANPAAGIDAYVWAKPPGESDGWYSDPTGKTTDRECDPTYTGNSGGSSSRLTGALSGAPPRGTWFESQFEELLRNAYPAL